MISVKSKREIELMAESGRILSLIHKALSEHVKVGITTRELDQIAEDIIRREGVKPAFKGYNDFPACLCTSVNEVVVHGIPNDIKLKDGDIISIDAGVIFEGYYSDAARTHLVGNVKPEIVDLVKCAKDAFYEGLKECYVGNRLSNIGNSVQTFVEAKGYGVVRDLVGHGVGRSLHEDPQVPNYGPRDKGPRLKEGMVIAVEPMITLGTWQVETLDDGWTVATVDGLAAAHHEQTIAITKDCPVILTNSEELDG